jgi:malonyl CoA-acyl carrier protein transacylase
MCDFHMKIMILETDDIVTKGFHIFSLQLCYQVRLAVAGAFHTSFMQLAVPRLESALAATEIRTPRIPVISNVDAQPHSDPDTIKQILARQVSTIQNLTSFCLFVA